MKLLIGAWETGGSWRSVIIGLFDDDDLIAKAEREFIAKHEGHNYFKTEIIDIELNKQYTF